MVEKVPALVLRDRRPTECVVQYEYTPGQTVNKYYLKVLRHPRDAVRRKQPNMWAANNTPAHNAKLIQHFPCQAQHWAISAPSLVTWSSPDFFLFTKLKSHLKGWRFDDVDDIKSKHNDRNSQHLFWRVRRVLRQEQQRWKKCMNSEG